MDEMKVSLRAAVVGATYVLLCLLSQFGRIVHRFMNAPSSRAVRGQRNVMREHRVVTSTRQAAGTRRRILGGTENAGRPGTPAEEVTVEVLAKDAADEV